VCFNAVDWYFTHDVYHMCLNLILAHIWDAFGFLRKIRCDKHGPWARRRLARGVLWPAAWWAATASWAVGPSLLRVTTTRSVFYSLWVCSFDFYYFLKGVFSPVIRGPLWLSPTPLFLVVGTGSPFGVTQRRPVEGAAPVICRCRVRRMAVIPLVLFL
jgi:hypothetical protein